MTMGHCRGSEGDGEGARGSQPSLGTSAVPPAAFCGHIAPGNPRSAPPREHPSLPPPPPLPSSSFIVLQPLPPPHRMQVDGEKPTGYKCVGHRRACQGKALPGHPLVHLRQPTPTLSHSPAGQLRKTCHLQSQGHGLPRCL